VLAFKNRRAGLSESGDVLAICGVGGERGLAVHRDDVDVELALEWLEVRKMRWTVGGLRAMFSDARRAGLIDRNPFLGLWLPTGPGRKNIDVLKLDQVFELADVAAATWKRDGYGQVWRALVLWQAFVGRRPAEAYGLVRADLDVAAVRRQRIPFTPRDATPDELPLPKNGKTRRVVIPPPTLEAIQALPRPIDPNAPLFGTRRESHDVALRRRFRRLSTLPAHSRTSRRRSQCVPMCEYLGDRRSWRGSACTT
jgi:integrase